MDLIIVWFVLLAVLWTGYLVLEGFDFGVGMLLPILDKERGAGSDRAASDRRRRTMLTTIGPHWDGNEVWLLTAGGATFAAFPHWYATMFSGMYLALLLLLVALIVRNMGLEYRHKRTDATWVARWDVAIIGASFLSPFLVGVALTNLVDGLPMTAHLSGSTEYTEFDGSLLSLLTPIGLLGGAALTALCLTHGAHFIALKTAGPIRAQARGVATKAGLGSAVLAVVLLVSLGVQRGNVFTWVTSALAAIALLAAIGGGLGLHRHGHDDRADRRDLLPHALPQCHQRAWRRSGADPRCRGELAADAADHDVGRGDLHPDRHRVHGVELLGLPSPVGGRAPARNRRRALER